MEFLSSTTIPADVSQAVSTMINDTTTALVQDVARVHRSSSWLGAFGRLILFILHTLSTIIYWSLKLTTISVPTLLFTLFSTSWTVTMNATTLALILFLMFSGATWVVRYRYLNMYSRLPPEPQRKEPELDLFPDGHEEGAKPGLSNYLDEFLSAIKIFGYLERPVFHELTRSMQTRKLIAGETFNLEEEQGFCLVVDGLVEIFVKSSHRTQARGPAGIEQLSPESSYMDDDDDDEHPMPGHQRYQLLTEVRNGNPMSSLFSIMSLFTEDVSLESPADDQPESRTVNDGVNRQILTASPGPARHRASSSIAGAHEPGRLRGRPGLYAEGSDLTSSTSPDGTAPLSKIPTMSLDEPSMPRFPRRPPIKRMTTTSVHPDIIARATVDTTIAIIPASAFRRLIRVYPKATAHIVHVILSRFQRVTLATAYDYLGLTSDVLHTERKMIKYASCQLPNLLRGDALGRLKEKFKQERERASDEESSKGIALHNPSVAGDRRRSATTLRKEAAFHAMARNRPQSIVASTIVPPQDRLSIHTPSPGDLLANVHMARHGGARSSGTLEIPLVQSWQSPDPLLGDDVSPLARRTFNPFATQTRARLSIDPRESVDEDNLFRVSILECVFSALGLNTGGTSSRGVESTEGSPRLVSYDQKRQKAVFSNNAFGFMDPFDGSADWDAESMTSGGVSMSGSPNAQLLAAEMKNEVEIVFFRAGSVLVEHGERSPGLYYVIDGFLDLCFPSENAGSEILSSSSRTSVNAMHRAESHDRTRRSSSNFGLPKLLERSKQGPDGKRNAQPHYRRVGLVKPGGLAGYIGTVSSYRSFVDVVAKTDVYVGFIPSATLEKIVERYPIVLLTMAKRLTSLLPKLILHIDFALEWVQVNAGQVLFNKDEESEAIYLVLNGRLRLVEDRQDGSMNVRAEFGQGDSVGELEVMTESARSGTLHAIRDTELVKFPRTLFNSLAQEHPNITIKISKIIASRMRLLVDNPTTGSDASAGTSINKSSSTLNIRTVAILPVRAGIPVVEFGNRLMNALTQVGTPNGATSLNQSAILSHLGKHAFNKMGKLKLSHYLADLEEKYGLVVYVADTSVTSAWTQTCITQADCILLVGLAEGSPEVGEYERFLLGTKCTARKTLVLLHADRYSPPGLTRSWLRNRVWINGGHYHVQMSFGTSSVPVHPPSKKGGPTLKERVQILQAEIQKYTVRRIRQRPYYSPDAPYKGDFQRLARRLCGKSIGVVLGGGGARGMAHVGILRAIDEAGIPIDIVGGTSIGSFVGGLYARHADIVPVYGLAKKFSGRMASMWRFALDLTYPSASYTTGHEFNRGIFKTFGKHQIEDFWLEFYCNTTNISKSRAEIHTSGYAWRYVRASMSLAGLLPPLCDEGSMLLDGGYIDNLTVSHMNSLGTDIVFAVDVGAIDNDTPQGYGDSLSGGWAFFNRWNPFSSTPNPPTLAEIQARLAYVSSVDALERAKKMPGCMYMRPPIDSYGTLDFGKFDELYELGYKYGQEFLGRLKEEGVLPLVEETEAKKALRRTMAPRRASI